MKTENVYPSWRYHKYLGEKLVKSADEDKKLESGWVHSPAHFESDAPEIGECIDTLDKEEVELPRRRGRPRKA